jgi:hypothetical protein
MSIRTYPREIVAVAKGMRECLDGDIASTRDLGNVFVGALEGVAEPASFTVRSTRPGAFQAVLVSSAAELVDDQEHCGALHPARCSASGTGIHLEI